MAPGFCLCPLRGCPSVSVCLPHVRLLPRPSVQFSSVWIPEPPFPPPGKMLEGGVGLEREQGSGSWTKPGPQVAGEWVPCCLPLP